MKKSETALRIYTVVEVWRGLAVGAKNFRQLSDAQRYLQRLRRRHNPAEDDVQLFTSSVLTSP
jgi:hypothetical protein